MSIFWNYLHKVNTLMSESCAMCGPLQQFFTVDVSYYVGVQSVGYGGNFSDRSKENERVGTL